MLRKIEIDPKEVMKKYPKAFPRLVWDRPKFSDPAALEDIENYLGISWGLYKRQNASHQGKNSSVRRFRILSVIRTLADMHAATSKKIAETYIDGLEKTSNKTYYINHIAYRYSAAIGEWSNEIDKNWKAFKKKRPKDVYDTYGNSNKGEKMKEKKAKEKKVKEKKEKKPTVTGTIEEFHKKGGTKEECLALLKKTFPDRSPEAMAKTYGVQMSYHLKKKYDVVVKKSGAIKLTAKEAA